MSSAVHWTLFRATLTCAGRRARPVLTQNPLVALLAAGGALGLPALAVVAGRMLGSALGPALASESASRLLAVDLSFFAALAGGAVALLAPHESALGAPLRAAPLSRATAFLALTAFPVALLLGVLVALGSFFLVPFAAATPGGSGAAAVLLAGGLAAFGCGAALLEAGLVLLRGSPAGLLVLGGVGVVWALGALAAGGGPLAGPLAYLAEALRDPAREPAEPLLALVLTAAAAFALWAAAASRRPPERAPRGVVRPLVPIARAPVPACFAAALKRYSRRRDLRRVAAATLVLAVPGALAFDVLLRAAPPSAFYLAGGLAVLGAALLPLAALGLDREADWLWLSAPLGAGSRTAASGLAAIALALALAGAAAAPVGLATGAGAGDYANLAGAALLQYAAAVAAGALVPWRADRLSDQLASVAAFAVLGGATTLALAAGGRRAVAAGLPELPVAAAAVGLALASAIALAAALASRRSVP